MGKIFASEIWWAYLFIYLFIFMGGGGGGLITGILLYAVCQILVRVKASVYHNICINNNKQQPFGQRSTQQT